MSYNGLFYTYLSRLTKIKMVEEGEFNCNKNQSNSGQIIFSNDQVIFLINLILNTLNDNNFDSLTSLGSSCTCLII